MAEAPTVAVVTVSYTGRMDNLVRQAEAIAGDPAVREWIVVANGNGAIVRDALPRLRVQPRVVELAGNTGSAVGFGRGLGAAAADPGNQHIFLLDEDNLPVPMASSRLRAVFAGELGGGAPGLLAVAAYRPGIHAAYISGIHIHRPDSSIGFHVADLPRKVLRRLWRRPRAVPSRLSIRATPYGGLFVHRDLVETLGLPLPDLVLYADDTEYTLRLVGAGGRTVLDTTTLVAEPPLPPAPRASLFSFPRRLDADDDFRLYYGARNDAWLDVTLFMRSRAVYALNKAIVRLVMRAYARTPDARRRLALFEAAAADGEAGRLGVHPDYPLPTTR